MIQLLLYYGADADLIARSGNTTLCTAVSYGHIDVVELLMQSGVDINLQDNGQTALMMACIRGDIEMVEILLTADDIDINARGTTSGYTALWYASSYRNNDIVELLELNGAIE